MPARARSSGDSSNRSLPSYNTRPPVTTYSSRPASTWASVLLPLPLGPMIAWTSPGLTVRSTPVRISRSPTFACRFFISSSAILTNASFETDSEQFLRFHGELHGELAKYVLAETVHDHRYRVLRC